MRRLAVAALFVLVAACSETPLPASTPLTAVSPPTTPPPTTSTTMPTTTTASATTTTTTMPDGPPSVDMVPAGYDIEDFVPLVEGYFAVRNWALEHPDQVTEDILATVIEPGSVEMRDTLAEIQELLDQDAHYEGLTETFVLVEARFFRGETDPEVSPTDVVMTVEYGASRVVTGQTTTVTSDTLRRAPWTLTFHENTDGSWLITEVLRNPFDHAPGSS